MSYCTPYLLPGAHNKKECLTTDGRDGFVGQKGEPGPLGPPGLAGVRVAGPTCPQEEQGPPGSQIGAIYTSWGEQLAPAQRALSPKPTQLKVNKV